MILIDGKKIAAELKEELKQEVSELNLKYNKVPGLTVILIGDLAPSQIYVRNKEKSANEVGLKSDIIKYPDSVELLYWNLATMSNWAKLIGVRSVTKLGAAENFREKAFYRFYEDPYDNESERSDVFGKASKNFQINSYGY